MSGRASETWSRTYTTQALKVSKTLVRNAGGGASAAVSSLHLKISSATTEDLLTVVICLTDLEVWLSLLDDFLLARSRQPHETCSALLS